MKIVILDGYALNPGDISWKEVSALGEVVLYDRTKAEDIVCRIGDAEIILTNKTLITKEVINACPNLKYIGVLATGYNTIDLDAAKEKGIIVTNIPDYSTPSVCQFVFALLLEMCSKVQIHNESVHSGEWVKSLDFCYWKTPLIELAGKNFGILGYGNIGSSVAKTAKTFGMNVLCCTRTPQKISKDSGVIPVSLDELFEKSHIISLHAPLTVETKFIINSNSIKKMQTGVLIINTARGPLVKEDDMLKALESGKVGFYGADVVSKEPMEQNNPLLHAPNCILTPHIAWATKESRSRLIHIAAKNIESYLNGNCQNSLT
ncbi:MAG: D-2-hydroxyacid dehydrogenase [Spirochaetaceae bacterium]|nr:D-2-hydroxyacid dehydrogenase [Spirochaetaceae bacterium]